MLLAALTDESPSGYRHSLFFSFFSAAKKNRLKLYWGLIDFPSSETDLKPIIVEIFPEKTEQGSILSRLIWSGQSGAVRLKGKI